MSPKLEAKLVKEITMGEALQLHLSNPWLFIRVKTGFLSSSVRVTIGSLFSNNNKYSPAQKTTAVFASLMYRGLNSDVQGIPISCLMLTTSDYGSFSGRVFVAKLYAL
eukprot:scaffold96144_cov17-Tisochrysis_lutea.AAC.1